MINILELEASKGWGGQEKRTVRLANNLPKDKVTVVFAANADSYLHRHQQELGIEVFPVKMRASWDMIAVFEIINIIHDRNIDIVVTHSGRDGWLGGMAAKLAGKKCVRVRHLQTPFASVLGYKYLTDEVQTVSEQVREYVISRGVNKDKVKTIYTGVDVEIFKKSGGALRSELGVGDNTMLVGIVAVLRGAKRHKLLLDAIKSLQNEFDIKLVIAGDGPQKANIQNYIAELGLQDSVYLLGHRDDIVNILSALDLFVLPSKMEALGTALLEAQSCGVPVIGSRVGGIPECVVDGETGYLFECDNLSDLTIKMRAILQDDTLRKKMSANARNLIATKFSTHTMVSQTVASYQNLLSNR